MDATMMKAVIDHGPLVVAVALAYWWATPRLLKATLRNGGGEIVREHVKAANAEQSIETASAIKRALEEHEGREFRQYGSLGDAVGQVRERMAALEARIADHLASKPVLQ